MDASHDNRPTGADAADAIIDLSAQASLLADASEGITEACNRLINLPDLGVRLLSIDVESNAASGALQVRALPKVSEAAFRLLSALRAANVQLAVVKDALCHFSSPVGCDDSTVEALAGRVTPSRCTAGEQAPC